MRFQIYYAFGAIVRTLYHIARNLLARPETVSIARLQERWAFLPSHLKALAPKKPVWIVLNGGEVTQAVTFSKLLHQGIAPSPVLLVTSNAYAAEFARCHLPWLSGIFEAPWDLEFICGRTLKQIPPRAIIFIENVYYPVLARTAQNLGIPTILASGLVQNRFRFHPLYERPFKLRFFENIDLHIVKSKLDARTLTEECGLPAERVHIGGNLKFDLEFLGQRDQLTELTRESLGKAWISDFVILAGSIHHPEEELIAKVMRVLRSRGHRVRLIVAPRYDTAAGQVAHSLHRAGISSKRRSLLKSREFIYEDALIIDTFGELPGLYPLADAVILGGTFFKRGNVGFGQNIVEPLIAIKPILHGPFIGQFEDIRDSLHEAWAGTEAETEEQLIHSLEELIVRPELRGRLCEKARMIINANVGNAKRHVDYIFEMLSKE